MMGVCVLVGFLWLILAYVMKLHYIIIIINNSCSLGLMKRVGTTLPFVLLTFLALLQFLNSKKRSIVCVATKKFLCWICCRERA